MGQAYDLSFLDKCGLNVDMTERGTIKTGADKMSTSVPGLFVAGDLAYGQKLVIDAVASGKKSRTRRPRAYQRDPPASRRIRRSWSPSRQPGVASGGL